MHKSNKYNISPLEVLKMHEVNACEICDEYMNKKCIDHDHVTGKDRGMICQDCNVLLAHAKD